MTPELSDFGQGRSVGEQRPLFKQPGANGQVLGQARRTGIGVAGFRLLALGGKRESARRPIGLMRADTGGIQLVQGLDRS